MNDTTNNTISNTNKESPTLPNEWESFDDKQKEEFCLKLIQIIDLCTENETSMYQEIKELRDKKNISIWYNLFYTPFYMLLLSIIIPFIAYIKNYQITFPLTILLWGIYLICGIL